MGKEMSKILPGLYVGRLDNAHDDHDMMANCITHVLSVHEPVKQKLIKSNSYTYYEINVKDDETAVISKYFSKTNDFIHEARVNNGIVLIHCLAGVSRAPTVVLAYLMTIYDLSFQDAFSCLRRIRPNIKPNNGFLRQLIEFEEHDKVYERERIFKRFGVWRNIEEDKKLLIDFINQNQDLNDWNDPSCGDILGSPLTQSFDGPSGFFNEEISSSILHHHHQQQQQEEQEEQEEQKSDEEISENDEDVDVPGSIPIGGYLRFDVVAPSLGNNADDFRGRAHSRGAQQTANDDQGHYSGRRLGSTAPPCLPPLLSSNVVNK